MHGSHNGKIFLLQYTINKSPEYVTMLCRKNYVCEPDLKQLKFELEKYGYKEIANDKESGLYKLEK